MEVLKNGEFSFEITHDELARGLRPSKRSPRNAKYLVECVGAVGIDQVLQVLDDLNELLIDTAIITDGFPYPQIFVFPYMTVVCGLQDIYEYNGSLVHKLKVPAGLSWSMIEYFDYVYASNARVAVQRRAEDRVWEQITTLPSFYGGCNFNGQVLIYAPDVDPETLPPTTTPPTTPAPTTLATSPAPTSLAPTSPPP